MSWGMLHSAMLLGLLGVAIPLLVHLLNRRWDPVVDWGAMQFLELGRRTQRRFQLTECLLMLTRMALLALVALALARPFWKPRDVVADARGSPVGTERRDVVIVLDGSSSMHRKVQGTTAWAEALKWARAFVSQLRTGDSVAVLVAKDRVIPLVDPPSFDRVRVEASLAAMPATGGSSDLAAALSEAFRILERTEEPGRDVIVLTDGQRFAWRPGEAARWALLRELHRRLPVPPRIWALAFGTGKSPDGPNGSIGPLVLSRGTVAPGAPIVVSTSISNAGPGPLTRTAELLVDGIAVPGSAQVVGPIPGGSRAPLRFKTTIQARGSHLVAARLVPGDDSLPLDDEAARPVEVAAALPVLLVDGDPAVEPFRGATDFLRAALSPAGDDTPQARATVVRAESFDRSSLQGQRVVVLANVERLNPEQVAAIESFLAVGGGVLIAPGDRTDASFTNGLLDHSGEGWLPAQLGPWKGELRRHHVVTRPAPSSFSGSMMALFGQGDDPPLARAGLFAYRVLVPATGAPAATVTARLDTGDPWLVERPFRRGNVAILAGPLEAKGGTLPVNPDFVPWIHELVFHLADAGAGTRVIRPGESMVLDLDPPPSAEVSSVAVKRPDGAMAKAAVTRTASAARVHYDNTTEPGVYQVTLPDPPGGSTYVVVEADSRESDLAPLEQAEAAQLARGWTMEFAAEPNRLAGLLFNSGRGGRREIWRSLVLVALAGLCVEVWLTRQLARGGGVGP